MTLRTHAITIVGVLALLASALLPEGGPTPAALEGPPAPSVASLGSDAVIVVEIHGLRERWDEVSALPGLAELLRRSATSLGWDEGAIPGDLEERESLVFRRGHEPWDLRLRRAPSADAASSARAIIDAAWDPRLGEEPLVRGIVDLVLVRTMLLEWAAAEPLPLRALLLEMTAMKIAPFERAVFSRDIVGHEIHFGAWLTHASGSSAGGASAPPAPVLVEPLAESGEQHLSAPGLRIVPTLLRFLITMEGLSLDVEAEEGGLLVLGKVTFDTASTDRP